MGKTTTQIKHTESRKPMEVVGKFLNISYGSPSTCFVGGEYWWRPQRRTSLCCPQDKNVITKQAPMDGTVANRNRHDRHRVSNRMRCLRFPRVPAGRDRPFELASLDGEAGAKTIRSEIVLMHNIGLLGHVKELRVAVIPRECPRLVGPDDIAWC